MRQAIPAKDWMDDISLAYGTYCSWATLFKRLATVYRVSLASPVHCTMDQRSCRDMGQSKKKGPCPPYFPYLGLLLLLTTAVTRCGKHLRCNLHWSYHGAQTVVANADAVAHGGL